jgi:PleD family two-component response regulator
VGGRVLLVEDDPATRVALRELLDDAGYAPTEAADGETALEALSAGAYDLLLLDLGLPGMSGGAVREIVRRDPRTRFLPIVLLSAHAEREAKVAELEAGADDYITKPYDADELLARLGAAVRRTNGLRSLSPLSGLPGNTTITEEIDAHLRQGDAFSLLYVDIDHFKEFNDHYGFARGDRMIARVAEMLTEIARSVGGDRFVGHIGGDDFVMLAGADESERLAALITRRFDEIAPSLYDELDRQRGWIEARDRRRHLRHIAFATLSIGIVNVAPGRFDGAVAAARAAAEVKELAKRRPGSTWAVDRRRS